MKSSRSPLIEFAIVNITTAVALLARYHFVVRYTPIGTLFDITATERC